MQLTHHSGLWSTPQNSLKITPGPGILSTKDRIVNSFCFVDLRPAQHCRSSQKASVASMYVDGVWWIWPAADQFAWLTPKTLLILYKWGLWDWKQGSKLPSIAVLGLESKSPDSHFVPLPFICCQIEIPDCVCACVHVVGNELCLWLFEQYLWPKVFISHKTEVIWRKYGVLAAT